jgi:S-DNA-T family DNA segregation ATPase FtsK/SpoIIIE
VARPSRSVRGWWQVTVWLARQAINADGWADVNGTRDQRNHDQAQSLTSAVLKSLVWRVPTFTLGIPAAATIVAGVVVLVAWHIHPALAAAVLITVVVGVPVVLGLAGRRESDPPILEAWRVAAASSDVQRLTEGKVLAGLAKIHARIDQSDDERAASMVPPGLAKVGGDVPGRECVIDLPEGVTNNEILDKKMKARLASALRIEEECIWMEPVKRTHPGRLRVFFAEQPLAAMGSVAWPLLRTGTVNLFESFPVGVDHQGQVVRVNLNTQSGKIAAKPRMGKTFLMRLLAAAVGLDVRARVSWYGLKGGGDGVPLKRICHYYASSAKTDEVAPQVVAELGELKADMIDRYDLMEALKEAGEITATQVNEELVNRHPRLGHHFVFIDECHELFIHPVVGKEALGLVTDLVKRGPAVGIGLILATQEPDSEAIPTSIRNNLGLGWCFRVLFHTVVDMALGSGAYSAGYDATQFDDDDKGMCWFGRSDGSPVLLKVAYINDEAIGPNGEKVDELDIVVDRALQLRKAAGTLTGYAAGLRFEAPEDDTAHLVEDLVHVWIPGEEQISNYELLGLLQDYKAKKYAGWKVGSITSHLNKEWTDYKPAQCPYIKEDGKRSNRNGVSRRFLHEAYCEVVDAEPPDPHNHETGPGD